MSWSWDGIRNEFTKDWPWLLFLALVSLRPALDVLWRVKFTTPLYSPLYFAGQLTLLVAIIGLRVPRRMHMDLTLADWVFAIFAVFLVANTVVSIAMEGSRIALKIGMKTLLPVAVYWFARRRVTAGDGLLMLARAVSWGTLVAYGMLVADVLFGPFGVRERSGFVRYVGLYSHVASYSYFLLAGFISTMYLWLRTRITVYGVMAAVEACLIALAIPYLVHFATTGLAAVLASVALLCTVRIVTARRIRLAAALLFTVLALFVVLRSGHQWSVALKPDMRAVSGTGSEVHALNGRGAIWTYYARIFESVPIGGKLLGPPLAGVRTEGAMGSAAHSDVLRLLFTVGIVGLLAFVLFLVLNIRAMFRLALPERFLSASGLLLLLGYAVTMTPTFYTNTVTFIFPILAMLASLGPHTGRSKRYREKWA